MNKITDRISAFVDNVYFLSPEAFYWLLALIPLSLLFFWAYKRDLKILEALRLQYNNVFKKYLLLLTAFAFLVSGTAGVLAQPVLQEYEESDLRVKGEYIFLIDVSRSSDARFTPDSSNQLELSKDVIKSLLEILEGSRIHIFAYTSAAFPMSDFSQDVRHMEETLDNIIYPEVIASSGSDMPNALASIARNKMRDDRYKNVKHVVLIADGQIPAKSVSDLDVAIDMLQEQEISLTTIGVGSIVGWRIPVFDEETGEFTGKYAQTRTSMGGLQDYVSVLNERNLQVLAGLTGGEYFHYEEEDRFKEYFIDRAEQEGIEVYSGERRLLETQDVSWVFVPFIMFGLFILVLKRNLI